jgi:hypothetical protein
MAVTAEEMYTQIKSALDAMGKPSVKEMETFITTAHANNFNKLLTLSKEAMPNVDERRWPASIAPNPTAMGPGKADSKFAEVRSYYGELLGILGGGFDPAPWGMS